VLAAVFVAEIGNVHRFAGAPQLCSWAGLTPRHHESDTTVRRLGAGTFPLDQAGRLSS
jgi:transposase